MARDPTGPSEMKRPAIVIPLYIYPSPGAWDPLLQAARAHPGIKFVVIVNPSSGPGPEKLPDANYIDILCNVRVHSNVMVLGYVHLSYGHRHVDLVLGDIDRYAAWESESCGAIRVDGVFLDEAPSSIEGGYQKVSLARYVREAWGRMARVRGTLEPMRTTPPFTPLEVMYNPGVLVDSRYMSEADKVVVFEQAASEWGSFTRKGTLQIAPELRWRSVAMIHSVTSTSNVVARAFRAKSPCCTVIDSIRQLGFGGIFLTDQEGGGYTRWPAMWEEVLAAL